MVRWDGCHEIGREINLVNLTVETQIPMGYPSLIEPWWCLWMILWHFTKNPPDVGDIWMFPKIGVFTPQNGWWKEWKTLWTNGWFGGNTSIFGSTPISGQIIIFHHVEPLGLIFEYTRKDSGQFIINTLPELRPFPLVFWVGFPYVSLPIGVTNRR